MGCELAQTWLREGVDTPIGVQPGWEAYDSAALEVRQEHRLDLYLDLLIEIKQQYPMKVCCHLFEIGGCRHGIRCECGGTQAPWPWIVHRQGRRFCDCHMEGRAAWIKPGGYRIWKYLNKSGMDLGHHLFPDSGPQRGNGS